MERAEGGVDGRHCLYFPPPPECPEEVAPNGARPTLSRTLRSVDVPVASGRNYKLSVWYRFSCREKVPVAYCALMASAGREWSMGDRFCVRKANEWQKLEVVSRTPVPKGVRNVNISVEINSREVWLDQMDFRVLEDDGAPGPARRAAAEKPYELQLAFDRGTPAKRVPPIVTWGERLPLEVAAMPKDGRAGGEVPVTLRVVAYPDRVTVAKRLTLVGGRPRKLEVDPEANGLVRVELAADGAALADPLEKVMARLPKPRPTGPESSFGTHLRVCPYFIDYAAAIGIKWQRLHDCSNMCKMKWGNPRRGAYQWADEIVDYMRAKGLNVLALPDYPAPYAMPTNAQGQVCYDNDAYRAWCRELAAHYRGRIDHFEIWNEPYMSYFYRRDAKEHGKTFNAGAEGIREGNPDAKVIGWCTELTSPKYVLPFLKDYPVAKRPDFNSVHHYYTSVPGDGELSYDRIIGNVKETFGEHAGDEIWNTEGNLALTHTFYARMRTFDRALADRGVAFGTRGWAEAVACGIAKTFLYTTHNTDGPNVGGLITLIDYDRSPTPEAAATAVTAHFIDGLRSVKGLPEIPGCRFRAFAGDGRTTILLWDDVLAEGARTLGPSRGYDVYDAMGNRLAGEVTLGMIPVFIVARGEDAAALAGRLSLGK